MSDAPSWVAAGGTIGAVAYALARDTVRENYRRPKLTMYVPGDSQVPPDATQIHSAIGKELQTHERDHITLYVRLPVRNTGRYYSATDVQVLVTSVERLDQPLNGVVPVRALKWADEETGVLDIPSGVTRYIDMLRLRRYDTGEVELSWLFFPEDAAAGKGGGDIRDQLALDARYSCKLAVAAKGTEAIFRSVVVETKSGDWRTAGELHNYVATTCSSGRCR